MIQLNLQIFGRGSSGGYGGGAGGHKGSAGGTGFTTTKVDKKEVSKAEPEKKKEVVTAESITDSRGNVKRIADGFKYNIYTYKNGHTQLFDDNVSAKDTREWIEDFKYDEKDGMFKNDLDDRKYIVKIKKAKASKIKKK